MIVTKRVRIVHSPTEDKYQVQYKSVWFGFWHNDESFVYRKAGQRAENFRPVDVQEQACHRAHARAGTLLEREVIFDGRK